MRQYKISDRRCRNWRAHRCVVPDEGRPSASRSTSRRRSSPRSAPASRSAPMPCTCCGISASSDAILAVGVQARRLCVPAARHRRGDPALFAVGRSMSAARRALHAASSRRPARHPGGASAREFDPDVVRLNHRVTGFTESADGVELHFADGTSVAGDMLIGADGLKSVVRAPDVRRLCRRPTPATRPGASSCRPSGCRRISSNRSCRCSWGRTGHVVCYYLRGGDAAQFRRHRRDRRGVRGILDRQAAVGRAQGAFRGWHPAIQTIIDAADKDQCYRWSLFNRPPIRDWSTGARHAARRRRASDAAVSGAGRGDGDRGRRGADARARHDGFDCRGAAALSAQPRRPHRAKIVLQSSANRELFHLRSEAEIRARFAKRDEGDDRNTLALFVQSADGRVEVTILSVVIPGRAEGASPESHSHNCQRVTLLYKSVQSGLFSSTSRIFQSRRHFLSFYRFRARGLCRRPRMSGRRRPPLTPRS